MSKESFFRKLDKIESQLREIALENDRKPGTFKHMREDIWKFIESGEQTEEEAIDFLTKLGWLGAGGTLTIELPDETEH